MYFVDTKDILFISLAIGVLLLTIFICVAIYQLTKVLKNVEEITKNFAEVSNDASHTSHLIVKGVDNLGDNVSRISQVLAKFAPTLKETFSEWNKKRKSKKK